MADNAKLVGISNSWSLISFAKTHGQMKVAPFVNKETGETFKSCAFVGSNNQVTLVSFSSNLGELSPAEIARRKDELQVVLLSTGNYKLCKTGADSWESVDLGI